MSRVRKEKRAGKGASHYGALERGRRGRLPRTVAFVVTSTLVLAVLAGGLVFRSQEARGPLGPKTAAIVDQLSLTVPNPDFVVSATRLLEQAGYLVDYYPGEEVTVEFYRHLPAKDYNVILFRVHSTASGNAVDPVTGEKTPWASVNLFTGEPYAYTKYLKEQQRGYLSRSRYFDGAPPLFGILPTFITRSMHDEFDRSLIILMGCSGLESPDLAKAFLSKGADAVVGWSGSVLAPHTDSATQRLLEKLLIEDLSLEEAIAQTGLEVGPDPESGAELRLLATEISLLRRWNGGQMPASR